MQLFVGSIFAYMILVFTRSLLFQVFVLQANTNMHNKMSEKVIRAKILFFDSNPIGRIVTRFSKDLTMIDILLPPLSLLVT